MLRQKLHIKFLAAMSGVLTLIPGAVRAADTIIIPVGTVEKVSEVVTLVIQALQVFTWVVFIVLNQLLDPRFIFDMQVGGQSSLVTILNSIWILARDLVNIAFAIILVVAAIIVIVTQKKDLITTYWSKFVLAIILVNFSWFIPRVIFDISNIAAVTVYNIPSMISNDECKVYSSKKLPGQNCQSQGGSEVCDCVYVSNAEFFMSEARKNELKAKAGEGWECHLGETLCIQKQKLTKNSIAGHSYILNGLIVNHSRLQSLATIPAPVGGSSVSQILVFLMREALILLFHILIFFPMLALLIAFFMRIPVLWLTMAFMPFAVLQYVLPEKITQGVPQKITDYFIKAAFLPAVVGVPLAIGYILVNAGAGITGTGFQGVKIKLLDDVGNFWQIVWMLMSMGVIWVGVFTALEKFGGAMAKGAGSIKNFGETLGKIAVKAPLAAPIIPGVGGNIFKIPQMVQGVNAGLSSGQSLSETLKQMEERGKSVTGAKNIADKGATEINDLNDKIEKLVNAIKANPTKIATSEVSALNEVLKRNGLSEVNAANPEKDLKDLVRDLKLVVKPADKNLLNTTDSHLSEIDRIRAANPGTPTP